MGAYVYHWVTCSTINYDIVMAQSASLRLVSSMKHALAKGRSVGQETLILGVPVYHLLLLLQLSRLRHEIIIDTVLEETVNQIQNTQDREHSPRIGLTSTLGALRCLFDHACRVFHALLLSRYDQQRGTVGDGAVECFAHLLSMDTQISLETLSSLQYPFHVLTWPLLVIGHEGRTAILSLAYLTEWIFNM